MEILKWPNHKLMKVSKETTHEDVMKLIPDMISVMKKNNGIGLAAPQVGILKRFFILDEKALSDCDERKFDNTLSVLINPVLNDGFGEVMIEEGCLSIPGERFNTMRCPFISVSFVDLDGNERSETFSGMTAIAIQHEIDHLDGIVLAERQPLEERQKILKRLEKYDS